MYKNVTLFVCFSLLAGCLSAQQFIPLWPAGKKANWNGQVVNDSLSNERMWRVGIPGMYAFPASKAENKGTTVLICPGGGYERVSYIYNGFNFAKWFNVQGINVFVLLYRLPGQDDLQNRQTGPVADAQRAMRILRANATAWHLDTNHIGVMGISAGGHVATTLATTADDVAAIHDSLDHFRFLPDFMILLSPVITMGTYAHAGSKKILLGSQPSQALVRKYSNELQVNEHTPASFLVHAQNDSSVNVRNSVLFYEALLEKNIQASMHIFPQGGHGIGLTDNPGSTSLWLNLLELWMREKGFLPTTKYKN